MSDLENLGGESGKEPRRRRQWVLQNDNRESTQTFYRRVHRHWAMAGAGDTLAGDVKTFKNNHLRHDQRRNLG
jgi:hypothetical protein